MNDQQQFRYKKEWFGLPEQVPIIFPDFYPTQKPKPRLTWQELPEEMDSETLLNGGYEK